MPPPAARHAKFLIGEPAAAEGPKNCLHVAAEVGAHADAVLGQSALQSFGKRRAEQHLHPQFRHAAGQVLVRERAENDLPAPHLPPALSRDHQQPRRRVEHGRDAVLADGNGHSHGGRRCKGCASCERTPAPPELKTMGSLRGRKQLALSPCKLQETTSIRARELAGRRFLRRGTFPCWRRKTVANCTCPGRRKLAVASLGGPHPAGVSMPGRSAAQPQPNGRA